MNIEKIGTVFSCFKVKFGTPRQAQIAKNSRGYIEFEQKWEPEKCLRGLEQFSHVWVLFWFHGNKNLRYSPVVRPPRLSERVGVLASRSPLRPNPIGLSLCKIEKVTSTKLYLSGIDLIDGTPVLDVKPYIHEYDSVEDSQKGWLAKLEDAYLAVEFTECALEQIASCGIADLQNTISDILRNDIRNRNDRSVRNAGKVLGFYYENLNILFSTVGTTVTVLEIQRLL